MMSEHSFFPYFMLVAFEAPGSILRALLLLLSYPLTFLLPLEIKLQVMIFIAFCGLRLKDMDTIQRTVLPKFYLENLHRVIYTSMPRVMVEFFLKEHLGVDHVSAAELHHLGPYFTGLLANFGKEKPDCVNICNKKHPKPVIFHDGRLAFFPTPMATFCMFMWLPMGFFLVIIRTLMAIFLPYKLAFLIGSFTGMRLRFSSSKTMHNSHKCTSNVLYVSNHRTLLDPLYLSTCVGKPITTVTYSISRISEALSTVRTARLTRNRDQDKQKIYNLLKEDDLMIFPEGTTCREHYLLRFSPLFAEMTDEIVPVAMDTEVSMFYANTATGSKALDPFFLLLNPTPSYMIHVLEKLPKEHSCRVGGKSSFEVANYIQSKIAEVLGFECTSLTRKDKYMLLAGQQGLVK